MTCQFMGPLCPAGLLSEARALQVFVAWWMQATEAVKGREWAEAQQAAAEAGLQDARLHMDWQDMRIADLEGRDVSQMASRYGSQTKRISMNPAEELGKKAACTAWSDDHAKLTLKKWGKKEKKDAAMCKSYADLLQCQQVSETPKWKFLNETRHSIHLHLLLLRAQ